MAMYKSRKNKKSKVSRKKTMKKNRKGSFKMVGGMELDSNDFALCREIDYRNKVLRTGDAYRANFSSNSPEIQEKRKKYIYKYTNLDELKRIGNPNIQLLTMYRPDLAESFQNENISGEGS
jgi:hypothetical protein